MNELETLRQQFNDENKRIAAHKARLVTLATKRPLGEIAWANLNSMLDPEAKIHAFGENGGKYSDGPTHTQGKSSGIIPGAL